MKTSTFTMLFLALLLLSCHSESKENVDEESPKLSYQIEDYALGIDQTTPLVNYIYDDGLIDNQYRLFVFNLENNSLHNFNLTEATQQSVLKLPTAGPNSIAGMNFGGGMKVVNNDTIILFRPQSPTISLFNSDGELYQKFSYPADTTVLGTLSASTPLAYRKGSLIIQFGYNIMEKSREEALALRRNARHLAKINLGSGETEILDFPYPSEYGMSNFSQQFDQMDIIYNPDIDKFIINFPISDSIYVTDFKGSTQSFLAKSELVSKISEMDLNNKSVNPSSITSFYYWTSDSYGKLIYHPDLKIYLRVARTHISDQNFIDRDFSEVKREIVVLDAEFRKIGVIPVSSSMLYLLLGEEGIYTNKDINKFNYEAGIEDSLFFEYIKISIEK